METRHSRQRDYLLNILKNTYSHPTAERLYDEMRKEFPNVSLATVYRNLRFLSDRNCIMAINAGKGSEHYDGNTDQHYHFYCLSCNNVYDINTQIFDKIDDELRKTTDFDIQGHSLIFHGKCNNCK